MSYLSVECVSSVQIMIAGQEPCKRNRNTALRFFRIQCFLGQGDTFHLSVQACLIAKYKSKIISWKESKGVDNRRYCRRCMHISWFSASAFSHKLMCSLPAGRFQKPVAHVLFGNSSVQQRVVSQRIPLLITLMSSAVLLTECIKLGCAGPFQLDRLVKRYSSPGFH